MTNGTDGSHQAPPSTPVSSRAQITALDLNEAIDRLSAHRLLGTAPREELAWLAARGGLMRWERGDIPFLKGEIPTELAALWVVLSGRLAIYVDRGAGPKKVIEWGPGDVSGTLPYSRMGLSPGPGIAVEASEIFLVHRRHFPELVRACPSVTTALVHAMVDRARAMNSSDLHDEKMLSLGKLSAGLAHELNNPASAAVRSAAILEQVTRELADASRSLGAASLSEEEIEALARLRDECLAVGDRESTSPIDRADREESIASWLEARGADTSTASTIAEAGLSAAALEGLGKVLRPSALDAALHWVTADWSTRALIADVRKSAARVYELVNSVKRFTYMDRASPELVDIGEGLRDTVTLMHAKAQEKSIALTLDVSPALPQVRGVGGDLNQIWSNLVDNALDAAPVGGHVWITARAELGAVVIRVIDDGEGIPPELLGRIFDPFFTTKPVGQGLGLGLDIAHRLVRRHVGDIEVESRPGSGRTEFRVTIPEAT
jgi:signal transduction histidine kinase